MIIRDNGQAATPPDPTSPNPGADYVTDAQDVPGDVPVQDRLPKSDHNRRLALGLDAEAFAAEAGITVEDLRGYEETWPDHEFDLQVAQRVGAALARLERHPPASQKVSNGPAA